jgi:ethanolaminephosphotransferase
MSTTASNYDLPKLICGTALAFVSFAVTLFSLNTVKSISLSGIFYTFSLLLYGVSMFASSYVEEEHNFWYLMTSTWFLYLIFNGCVLITCHRIFTDVHGRSKRYWFPLFFLHPSFWVLALFRIVRAWNQTGQKYAGAPDIVHAFATMPSHNYFDFVTVPSGSAILWFLVVAAYLSVYARMSRHIGRELAGVGLDSYFGSELSWLTGAVLCLPLIACALAFKLAFTVKDAPELTTALPKVFVDGAETLPLVELAQVVFVGLGTFLGLCLTKCALASRANKKAQARGEKVKRTGSGGKLACPRVILLAQLHSSLNDRQAVLTHITDQEAAIFDIITLFLMTQTKAQNIPLYLIFSIQSYSLCGYIVPLPLPIMPFFHR